MGATDWTVRYQVSEVSENRALTVIDNLTGRSATSVTIFRTVPSY